MADDAAMATLLGTSAPAERPQATVFAETLNAPADQVLNALAHQLAHCASRTVCGRWHSDGWDHPHGSFVWPQRDGSKGWADAKMSPDLKVLWSDFDTAVLDRYRSEASVRTKVGSTYVKMTCPTCGQSVRVGNPRSFPGIRCQRARCVATASVPNFGGTVWNPDANLYRQADILLRGVNGAYIRGG